LNGSLIISSATRGLARTLARAGVGARTLTAHRQAAAMTETAVAADVHQALDVHRGLAAQVAFDRVLADLVADLFQVAVRQVLDLLGVGDAAGVADLARALTADAEDRRQADFGVLCGGMLIPAIRAMVVCPLNYLTGKRGSAWRCLWRGSVQITRTTPLRRMILQLRQIFLTEADTLISFS
jgi:hypothetical protein